jgi:ribosome-associated translation inhibitor RaiA
MKLTVQHFHLPSIHPVDALVEERILALHERLRIDEASVRLEHQGHLSPPFRVSVHLVIPGPDVLVESRGHTLRAAIDKTLALIERTLDGRAVRRRHRHKTNLSGRRAG